MNDNGNFQNMNASEAVPEPRNPEPQDSSQKKHEQKKQSRRYPQLDVLRGFALSGIVLINAPAILQVSLPEPEDSFSFFPSWSGIWCRANSSRPSDSSSD
ncbi:hypothetical protein ODZ83_02845 [Acaricomes phytoseiuli]|uniref:hypothetical protein n=1 Tax=Acaricomes phytoseiuli TaxID=291968 RepID=UPI0012EA2040|nr:hypothetical protein [Acaricomes phytoseiuli]MCW1249137.1 hypothetical protein [Acaricomes phytoseiuli]